MQTMWSSYRTTIRNRGITDILQMWFVINERSKKLSMMCSESSAEVSLNLPSQFTLSIGDPSIGTTRRSTTERSWTDQSTLQELSQYRHSRRWVSYSYFFLLQAWSGLDTLVQSKNKSPQRLINMDSSFGPTASARDNKGSIFVQVQKNY